MTKAGVSHDTVPYFMERFRDAYTTQLENFAENVLHGPEPADHRRRWGAGAGGGDRGDPGAGDGSAGHDRQPGGGGVVGHRRHARTPDNRADAEGWHGVAETIEPVGAVTDDPQGAVRHTDRRDAGTRRVGLRRVRGASDRRQRYLAGADGRQRSMPGAALGAGLDRVVAGAGQAAAARTAARRLHRLSARRVSAAGRRRSS